MKFVVSVPKFNVITYISNNTQLTDYKYLSGSIPTEIGSLTSLTRLDFSKCGDKHTVPHSDDDLVKNNNDHFPFSCLTQSFCHCSSCITCNHIL